MFSQAKAAQLHGETRRWNFNEMQNLKKKTVGASVDEEHKPTEIFIMLPLDIIAVGELEEGGVAAPSTVLKQAAICMFPFP